MNDFTAHGYGRLLQPAIPARVRRDENGVWLGFRAGGAPLSEKGVRLAQKMLLGPCNPVEYM